MKEIKIVTEYITLGQFLKYIGIIENGAMAKTFLNDNIVYVNKELENRRGKKIYLDDIIEVLGEKYQIK